jgi:chemotaxis protein MotB
MDEPIVKLGPEPPSMKWLLTFADLISLLLTFFILLFSMKVIDAQQWESLRGAFDSTFSVQEVIIDTKPVETDSIEKIDSLKADNLDYLATILKTRFHSDPVLAATEVHRNVVLDTLTLNLPSKLLFDSGSANMKQTGTQTMANLGDLLRHVDNRIEVAGHTDPNPINTSEFPTNWELSAVRALNVAEALMRQGIESYIPAVAYSDTRFHLLDSDKSMIERYQEARRVEIIIHGKK